MQRGGFTLHKWSANDPCLLGLVGLNDADAKLDLTKTAGSQCILGLNWDPSRDDFYFRILNMAYARPTKRCILSLISRLYDPLGWVTPVIITAKMIMLDLFIFLNVNHYYMRQLCFNSY